MQAHCQRDSRRSFVKCLLLYSKKQHAWARYVLKHYICQLNTDFQQSIERLFCSPGNISLLNFKLIRSAPGSPGRLVERSPCFGWLGFCGGLPVGTLPHTQKQHNHLRLNFQANVTPWWRGNGDNFNPRGKIWQTLGKDQNVFRTEMFREQKPQGTWKVHIAGIWSCTATRREGSGSPS